MKRGDKIYLDSDNTKESAVNWYLSCRDGIVEMYEYIDCSGYGGKTRLYLCQNTKHESVSIIRQTLVDKEWREEQMVFDSDSFSLMESLIKRNYDNIHGEYKKLRDYNKTIRYNK